MNRDKTHLWCLNKVTQCAAMPMRTWATPRDLRSNDGWLSWSHFELRLRCSHHSVQSNDHCKHSPATTSRQSFPLQCLHNSLVPPTLLVSFNLDRQLWSFVCTSLGLWSFVRISLVHFQGISRMRERQINLLQTFNCSVSLSIWREGSGHVHVHLPKGPKHLKVLQHQIHSFQPTFQHFDLLWHMEHFPSTLTSNHLGDPTDHKICSKPICLPIVWTMAAHGVNNGMNGRNTSDVLFSWCTFQSVMSSDSWSAKGQVRWCRIATVAWQINHPNNSPKVHHSQQHRAWCVLCVVPTWPW